MKSVLVLAFLISISFAAHSQDKATLFGNGVISTPYHEWTTTFAPDCNTVYFSRGTSPEAILYSKKLNGKWQTPQIADFSGRWYDTDPFITRDGKHLYFCSNRPADQKSTTKADKTFHIWIVARVDEDKWSKPELLDTLINHQGVNSWYPSETEDGDFYFHSYGRPGGHGKNDIYLSKHTGDKFTAPMLISIDTAGFNTQECAISKGNDFMLFISNKPGGIGLSDIYITFNKNGLWSKPINMGPQVNHPHTTVMSPALSRDETTLYFATNYIPVPETPTHMANYREMLKKLNSVYNGFANIYSIPLNIAALRSKAVW